MNEEQPVLEPRFESLLWPIGRERFIEEHWGQRHFVAPSSDSGRLSRLLDDFAGFDLGALAGQCARVTVCFESLEAEFRSISVPPADALRLYDAGMTLYFDLAQGASHAWAAAVCEGLGLPEDRVHCSVFASRRGGGLDSHFDAGEGFNVQIRGTKRWRLRPNAHVLSPTLNQGMEAHHPGELSAYVFDPLPATMPEGAEELELGPGSVLYVPQGLWHETRASADSLSLNICLHHISWLDDVLLPALRSTLLRHEKWRRWPRGLSARPADPGRARAELAALLASLPRDLEALTPDCVLPPASAELVGETYRRNPLVTLHVDRYIGEHEVALRLTERRPFAPLRQLEIHLGAELVPACRWLSNRSEPFSCQNLAAAASDVGPEQLDGLLELLVRQRAIARAR